MRREQLADVIVGTIGDAAETLADPRRGFSQVWSAVSGKRVTIMLAGLAAGLLIACARRRD